MEAATGVDKLTTALEVVGVGLMCEIPLEAWSWCTRAAEAAEAFVITDRPTRSASSTAYLLAVSEGA